MQGTRPDLAYAISVLSKHTAKPQQHHLEMAERVLRYLRKTYKQSLTYTRWLSERTEKLGDPIQGFTDSDWAGDATDRHSTSGYLFLYSQSAISWKVKKQSLITLSTTEAEYVRASEASKEAIWLRRMLYEILSIFADPAPLAQSRPKSPTPITLFIDNCNMCACSGNSTQERGSAGSPMFSLMITYLIYIGFI